LLGIGRSVIRCVKGKNKKAKKRSKKNVCKMKISLGKKLG
jgi:hypothetical protein